MRSRHAVWALLGLVVCALVGALVWAAAWRWDGGTWFRVDSPSMGTQAPVGSLLWVAPVEPEDLAVGDLITFRAPSAQDRATYTHQVTGIHADGTWSTAGAISGPDPWRVAPGDLVGRVQRVWFGAGVALEVLPLLLLLGGATALVVRRVRRDWRLPLGVLGAAISLTAVLVVYQPLSGARQLSFAPVEGGARASWVNTGLVPMRLHAERGGGSDSMMPGEVGTVLVTQTDARGRYEVVVSPAVPWWCWAVLIGVCFVPAVLDLFVRSRARRASAVGS